jgi:large subunit ribosomal protein L7A
MVSAELLAAKKAVGFNQTKKAVKNGIAKKVYAAHDADENFLESIKRLCEDGSVPLDLSAAMAELKEASQIDVDCAVCAILE